MKRANDNKKAKIAMKIEPMRRKCAANSKKLKKAGIKSKAVIILLSLWTNRNHIQKFDSSVVFLEPKIIEILDNETGEEKHNISLQIENTVNTTVDCSLNFTIWNETYKNSTTLYVGVLEPDEIIDYNFGFVMPSGQSDLQLKALC